MQSKTFKRWKSYTDPDDCAELRVHLKGALKNGCTPKEIREVLLLVALYCGLPAANEAYRAAVDVIPEETKR